MKKTCPPHCSHRLQPLDRTFLRSLKAAYSRSCENWIVCNKGRRISQFDVIPLFKQAYNSLMSSLSLSRRTTRTTATNGFNATGLCPLDDSKFEELFAIIGNQEEGGMGVVVAADVHATLIVANQMKMTSSPPRP